MAATAQSATAVIGIDIGWSRVPPLSQWQLSVSWPGRIFLSR